MSSEFQGKNKEIAGAFARELRQFQGLSASFFRAAAAQSGMTVTDMQVVDLLDSIGEASAGQLAELTGLTTGAITGMLNRLEEAGLVRRERDPNDGRRVIVRLEKGKDEIHKLDSIFASSGNAWNELVSHYDEEQVSFLREFLKSSNALSRQEIIRLREVPADEEGIFSAPLLDVESGRLVVSSGISQLTLRADKTLTDLYQAHFEGTVPDVKAKEGVVTMRYPRGLWAIGNKQRVAEVVLNAAIPWQIGIQGGAAEVVAELDGLNLAGLEVKGGLSTIRLKLPMPENVVPIRISGGASEVIVRRPGGVAARVHLKGWASSFIFDDQRFSNMGNDVRMQSSDFNVAAPYYDIEVASSVSTVTITTVDSRVE
ncbi:MAG TPA: MarR family transcriptional regulator [Ktedonobacter sp.]|nr:MarR family transcriptional regulator [Ktedonobacter sp.]